MSRTTVRIATVLASLATAVGVVQAAPAMAVPVVAAVPAAVAPVVPSSFFGVHDFTPIGRNGWPLTTVGSYRTWDAGVSWREIERTKGVYDFTRLDAITATARQRNAEVLVVLGMTPSFYATKVRGTDVSGPGSASMPGDLNAWKRYVQAVADRPNIRGNPKVQFQVWNEANVPEFWSGTAAQMATLTKATRDALTPTQSSRFLVGPALVTRSALQRTLTDQFFAQKVGGRPVADYLNAVSLQLYPLSAGRPEDSLAILALDRKILAKYRVNRPIWNTEVNYGFSGPDDVAPLTTTQQAANVARTLVLNAEAGISRVYWYAWGNTTIANTRTTGPNGYSPTMAGKTFSVARSWLVDSQMLGCTLSTKGTYTCTVKYARGVRRVIWNPDRGDTVTIPGAATDQLVDGTTHRYSPRTMTLRVGPLPIMVVSAR